MYNTDDTEIELSIQLENAFYQSDNMSWLSEMKWFCIYMIKLNQRQYISKVYEKETFASVSQHFDDNIRTITRTDSRQWDIEKRILRCTNNLLESRKYHLGSFGRSFQKHDTFRSGPTFNAGIEAWDRSLLNNTTLHHVKWWACWRLRPKGTVWDVPIKIICVINSCVCFMNNNKLYEYMNNKVCCVCQ